jgi:hypothetical protein
MAETTWLRPIVRDILRVTFWPQGDKSRVREGSALAVKKIFFL